MTQQLSHLDTAGNPRMVDITSKATSLRDATAEALVRFPDDAWKTLSRDGFRTKKGSVMDVARIAGVMAAKRTPEWIPFCHSLPLEKCSFDIEPEMDTATIRIVCSVATTAKTGVEMEALTGASAAALALYDMTKSLGHGILIEQIRLLRKTGGKSDYSA